MAKYSVILLSTYDLSDDVKSNIDTCTDDAMLYFWYIWLQILWQELKCALMKLIEPGVGDS